MIIKTMHIAGISNMFTLGSGANREVEDYMLTRYACYLIAENGDQALFGGFTTKQMKERLGVQDKRSLADFLPTLTIAAKKLAEQSGKLTNE